MSYEIKENLDKLNNFQIIILIICILIVIYVIYHKLTRKEVDIKLIDQEHALIHNIITPTIYKIILLNN